MNKKYFIYIIGLLACVSAYSQDSLMNYLEIAAKNNPTVLQKLNEYEVALQKVPQAGSLPDPQLSAGIFLSPMELVMGKQVAEFQLMQMFPLFGVLKNAKDEMSLMAKAKYESMRDAKSQVFYDVQRTWYELYRIQEDIRISQKNIEILKTLERLSLVKYKAVSTGSSANSSSGNSSGGNSTGNTSSSGSMGGMNGSSGSGQSSSFGQPSSMQSSSMSSGSGITSLADLYRIQIEIGDLENNIALLENNLNTVTARFNAYLNRKATTPLALPDSLKTDSLSLSLTAVSDSILANNPMLGMLDYEQQSLAARKKMVTRMGYPMVGLGVNYSLINKSEMSTSEMNGRDMIMPMVTVTLPIYRKKYKAMQTEAELTRAATAQNYKATANSLQTEYYEALQQYQDAERRIKLYKSQSELAQKSLDIMIRSFSASTSGTGLTDLLSIRQQLLDYEIKQIGALVDYNTSIAWLKRLMSDAEGGRL
jgi:outer membrane protein TolC